MTKSEFQEQEVTGRHHRRSAIEAFNRDISRVLIELITNSCDSYKRTKIKDQEKIVRIIYNRDKRIIEIIDNGEGVNFYKKRKEKCFKEIMKKGEKTSGWERGLATRGFQGIGLKDVCIAIGDAEIASIKNRKLSIINYGYNSDVKNYGYWPIKKDSIVTREDKKRFQIKEDGFYVKLKIPREWNLPEFGKLKTKLQTHRELRKILINGEFKIYLNSDIFNYELPKGKIVDAGNFYITWKKIKFKINYIFKLAETHLDQTTVAWRDRIGGILIYHSQDAVLDLTLFKFNTDPYAKKSFGEVEISPPELKHMDRLLEEGIIDEKRRGLDIRKDFNKKLIDILEKKLQIIVDKEKEKEKGRNKDIITNEESQRILNSINNLIKSEIGKAITDSSDVPSWRPVDKPFSFFPSNTEVLLKELERRKIYLIVNKKLLNEDEIILKIDNKNIEIKPKKININEESFDEEGYLLKKIILYSTTKNSLGILTAMIESHEESITVKVIENEKINPEEGFAFVPNKIKIIENKDKNIDLIFNKQMTKLGSNLKLTLNSKNIKIKKCPTKIKECNITKLTNNIYGLKVTINGEKIGTSAKISAEANNKIAEALIEVVEEREIKRKNYLEKIEFNEMPDPISISKYDENEKTLWIYMKHPVILQHRRNVEEDIKIAVIRSQDLILLLADIITRVICSLIAKEYNKKVIGEMQISSQSDFELTFNEIYRRHGTILSKFTYDIVINYINSQIEDSNNEISEND